MKDGSFDATLKIEDGKLVLLPRNLYSPSE